MDRRIAISEAVDVVSPKLSVLHIQFLRTDRRRGKVLILDSPGGQLPMPRKLPAGPARSSSPFRSVLSTAPRSDCDLPTSTDRRRNSAAPTRNTCQTKTAPEERVSTAHSSMELRLPAPRIYVTQSCCLRHGAALRTPPRQRMVRAVRLLQKHSARIHVSSPNHY